MKLRNRLVLALLCLALVALPCAGLAEGVTVTDMAGRVVELAEPATRVVALTASDCEILYALGAGDLLVGRGEYCDYPAEVLDVEAVSSGAETNIEQIVSLQPQVVIMATMAQTEEQVQALEAAGIRVVVSDAQDIAGVYTAIELIGDVVGKADEADHLGAERKSGCEAIQAKVTGDGSETVYFEVSPLEWGLWTSGAHTFMDELAQLLGLTNAFADVEGWAEVSEEQVIERDPTYIVTTSMDYGTGVTPVDEILGRTGWQDMTAIRNGKVFNADSNQVTRPGPRLVEAAEALYAFVYGGQD